jgi:hypothetical protein
MNGMRTTYYFSLVWVKKAPPPLPAAGLIIAADAFFAMVVQMVGWEE